VEKDVIRYVEKGLERDVKVDKGQKTRKKTETSLPSLTFFTFLYIPINN
jgi:hypothetical protein